MKRFAFAFIGVFGLAYSAWAGVEGVYVTEPNEDSGASAFVEIAPCGDKYCGTIIGNTAGTDNYKNLMIVWDMVTTDGANFSDGQIKDPTNDKTYRSKMFYDGGNILKVSGCVGPFCRAQTWTRKAE